MTIFELKSYFINELIEKYPKQEILSFFHISINDKLNLNKSDVFLEPNQEISENNMSYFKNIITSLNQDRPIQYIIGNTEFYGLKLKVNESVLIPRPETEELVEWIITDTKSNTNNDIYPTKNILDIGTGSGCIAISLAKNLPKSKLHAIDISNKAIEIANENAKMNNVNIIFSTQDILNITSDFANSTSTKYDIIVSNPPYVRELEKQEIKNNVLHHEPHTALFVSDSNPLLFYDKIAEFAIEHLSLNGKLYFEINQYLYSESINLLKQKGFERVELRKDIFGNKRMLKASLKSNL
ncbi:UNVERIFIED_CONTAM: hypothetical protein GTU68_046590 [Idotea baltica]|nr:hypothetical protein [Idotea baltica]